MTSRTPHRAPRTYWGVLFCYVCLAACAARSPCPTFAFLQHIRTADGAAAAIVIERGDQIVPWNENTVLQRGDTVTTDARTSAVLSFAGSQALLEPSTSVTLGALAAPPEQSVSACPREEKPPAETAAHKGGAHRLKAVERSGPEIKSARKTESVAPPKAQPVPKQENSLVGWITILVKKGRALVDGAFTRIETDDLRVEHSSTKYDVRVDEGARKTTINVLEGDVTVSSLRGGAGPVCVGHGRRLSVGPHSPGKVEPVPPQELAALAEEVEAMGRPLGPEVPDVVGLEIAAAEAKLKSLGIKARVLPSMALPIEPAKRGQVLGQDPAPRAHGERVILLVAAVEVPSVVGRTKAQAEASLKHAGMVLGGVENPAHTSDPDAIVVWQNPDPGAEVAPGTYVLVGLAPSKPEAAGVVGSPKLGAGEITVPDVTGAAPAAALETLRNAGLLPWVEASSRPDLGEARVTYQEPLPGQKARAGARVRVVVAHPTPGKEN